LASIPICRTTPSSIRVEKILSISAPNNYT
jgi:hypothetical protein